MSLRMPLHEAQAIQRKLTGKEPAKPAKKGLRSKLEENLVAQLDRMELPEYVSDYRWHSTRQWKWDIAFVDQKIAVEVDGARRDGKGDHQTEKGMTNDCQKQCNGALWGWTVIRVTATMVKSGEAAEMILRLLTRYEVELASRGLS